jgi:hypothetical protein
MGYPTHTIQLCRRQREFGCKRHGGQRDEMGILTGVCRLAFPELERLGPEAGVKIDGGPPHVQHFPAALRGQYA